MAVVYKSLGHSKSFFLLNSNRLLSVTRVIYEKGLRVPLFLLVQQPSMPLKYSYDLNPNAFALVVKEKAKKSFGKPSALPSPPGFERIITDAHPLSFRFPARDELEGAEIDKRWAENFKIEDIRRVQAVELDKLTKYDRQRGWCEESKGRSVGSVKDKFYKHLQSNLKFRSKVEVYYFIQNGKRPAHGCTKRMMDELNKYHGGSPIKNGDSLLEMMEVGQYDEEAKKICRRPIVPTVDQLDGTSEKAKRGNKKRKRAEDKTAQGQTSEDANINPPKPKIFKLYDFQPLV